MAVPQCLPTPKTPLPPRPPWLYVAEVIVSDPRYGDVTLTIQPLPLYCYKSGLLADGTAWMWMLDPWHAAYRYSVAGMLFFATAWERWIRLDFVSKDDPWFSSVWSGGMGTGRMLNQTVTITQTPTKP